jgi:hypothetical protein
MRVDFTEADVKEIIEKHLNGSAITGYKMKWITVTRVDDRCSVGGSMFVAEVGGDKRHA